MSNFGEKPPAGGVHEKTMDPPGYETTSGAAKTTFVPQLVTSTYVADSLEAYVEVDSVAHGHWDGHPATLVMLVIAHVRPRALHASTVTLRLLAAAKTEGPGSSTSDTAPRPALLLHAPDYLRRQVTKGGEQDYLRLGVFAPAPRPKVEEQDVVIVLDDPLLAGLPDRAKVCLVIASYGQPFRIHGLIRPQVDERRSKQDRIDRNYGALIDPDIGPAADMCNLCPKSPASSAGSTVRCAGLDSKHVTYERWLHKVVTGPANLHKWRAKDEPSEASWCNDRSASASWRA